MKTLGLAVEWRWCSHPTASVLHSSSLRLVHLSHALYARRASDCESRTPRVAGLVRYTWDTSVDSSTLQQLAVTAAVAVHAEPADAFEGDTLVSDGAVSVLFKAPGYIRLDYGLERPAWLEGISADLNATGQSHL